METNEKSNMLIVNRRQVLAGLGAAGCGLLVPALGGAADAAQSAGRPPRFKQSVSYWCFKKWYPVLDDFCKAIKPLGIGSVELLGPQDWPTLKENGMTCALGDGGGLGIAKGFNRLEHHDELCSRFEKVIDQAAEAGVPTLICMSGNREGMDDETGLKNCAIGLKRILPLAERKGVTLAMELLSSKRMHKDYMCDHTAWGVKLCQTLGSERFKLLYDVFHMQIMEGDLIETIKGSIDAIAHIHTGGVPGRNELDESQEINYRAVMAALGRANYQGWIGHEFIPTRDPLQSLAEAVNLCGGA